MKPGWEGFEEYARDLFGLRSTIGSGSKFYDQGDGLSATTDPFPVYMECKYTEKGSYSLKRADFLKWEMQAVEGGARNLVMGIRIWPRGLSSPLDLAVMDLRDAQELIHFYNEGNRGI